MGARSDGGCPHGMAWQLSGDARDSNTRGGSDVSWPSGELRGDLVAGSDSALRGSKQRSIDRIVGLSRIGVDRDDWIGSVRALQSATGTRRYARRCPPGL